jgi:hypothetical protein
VAGSLIYQRPQSHASTPDLFSRLKTNLPTYLLCNRYLETAFAVWPANVQKVAESRIKTQHLCLHFVSILCSEPLSSEIILDSRKTELIDKYLVERFETTPQSTMAFSW